LLCCLFFDKLGIAGVLEQSGLFSAEELLLLFLGVVPLGSLFAAGDVSSQRLPLASNQCLKRIVAL
jgi:hypothetical protein